MPNINITDSRKRDAVVKAENTTVHEEVRYVDSEGSVASTRKVLKATVAHDYETLSQQFGDDPEKLGYALIEGDPEVDMERCGVFLWGVSKVYVTSDDGIVYRIEQTEKVRDTEGNVKETRPRRRAEANVDAEIPLTWTGRKVKKTDAIRRFVFTSKLQIVHVNGLTYDFLYGMAQELENESSLMMVGGGSAGKDPLVFRRGSVPYRGFLEGRVQGDQYILLLHLSNMELKVPEPAGESTHTEKEADKDVTPDKPKEKTAKKKIKVENGESAEVASSKAAKSTAAPVDAAESNEKKAGAQKAAQPSSKISDSGTEKKGKNSRSVSKKPVTTSATKTSETADDSQSAKSPVQESVESSKAVEADKAGTRQSDATAQGADDQQAVDTEDLGIWLKSIRMGKYLELFIANEIDVDVLSELTDDDLKELDIPLGSRRRLLKAVSEADNLRAEVAMTVSKLSRSNAKLEAAPDKVKTAGNKTAGKKKAGKKKSKKRKVVEKKSDNGS